MLHSSEQTAAAGSFPKRHPFFQVPFSATGPEDHGFVWAASLFMSAKNFDSVSHRLAWPPATPVPGTSAELPPVNASVRFGPRKKSSYLWSRTVPFLIMLCDTTSVPQLSLRVASTWPSKRTPKETIAKRHGSARLDQVSPSPAIIAIFAM
jgi:hypothetical protein